MSAGGEPVAYGGLPALCFPPLIRLRKKKAKSFEESSEGQKCHPHPRGPSAPAIDDPAHVHGDVDT